MDKVACVHGSYCHRVQNPFFQVLPQDRIDRVQGVYYVSNLPLLSTIGP